MKKIGIVTLNGYKNYGNRLQNYALEEFLRSLDYDVETIWITNLKKYLKELYCRNCRFNKDKIRFYKFYKFSKKNNSIRYFFRKNNISKNYDYFVLGSDQVWNYEFETFCDDMFLSFSDREKNIAYAASFGFEKMPENMKGIYKKGLANFKAISVREETGITIINNLDKALKPTIVIDPTLLLSAQKWRSIETKPKGFINEKYVLNYFLGDIPNKINKEIIDYAKKNNYAIINVLDEKDKYYTSDPSEFLFLIRNASLVCTDSFHSTVFSIIYDNPFIVFKRNGKYSKMFSRIETLLNKFDLMDHVYNGKFSVIANNKHHKIEKVLAEEKEKATAYIKNNLKEDK